MESFKSRLEEQRVKDSIHLASIGLHAAIELIGVPEAVGKAAEEYRRTLGIAYSQGYDVSIRRLAESELK